MDEETRAALRQALDEFATIDPRACTVVTLRQFWEFSCAEIAASFGVTERTVNRDWRAARAWLARRVNQILGVPGGGPPRE
jgi:DNA-directed RNA polymerase specialized sigma24 family protein